MTSPQFDVVGVGLNATDTMLVVGQYPPCGGKVRFTEEILSPGGQVASAMVACSTLGMRAKYIGSIGDDERGRIQIESLRGTGVNLEDVEIRANCSNQSAYIVIDRETGERTVFWSRHDCLELDPETITAEKICCAKLLHIDGHDTAGVAKAARLAKEHGMPVTVDVDTIYPGFENVLPHVDYLIASETFPTRWTREADPFRALEILKNEFPLRVAAMTLGSKGALAFTENRFVYSPGFVVDCVDTTGAGDVFHGAFCYSVVEGMQIEGALEFSNAMAALNCRRLGARGGIATREEVLAFMAGAARQSSPDYRSAHQTA